MFTINDAINYATDHGFIVSEIYVRGMSCKKYFYVHNRKQLLEIVHCGGKKWVVEGSKVMQGQASCIRDAVDALRLNIDSCQ